MRVYDPKYPLEVLDTFLYPNLLEDGNGKVLSENITFFRLSEMKSLDKILKEMEFKAKKSCRNAEIAYHDFSGNRWIFLILNGKPTESKLRRMETIYRKLYRRMSPKSSEKITTRLNRI